MEKEKTEQKTKYLITTDFEFFTAKTEEILKMDTEKTLEYILWLTQNQEFKQDMDAFRKHINNILSWIHQINMKSIDRCIDNHIEVVIEK